MAWQAGEPSSGNSCAPLQMSPGWHGQSTSTAPTDDGDNGEINKTRPRKLPYLPPQLQQKPDGCPQHHWSGTLPADLSASYSKSTNSQVRGNLPRARTEQDSRDPRTDAQPHLGPLQYRWKMATNGPSLASEAFRVELRAQALASRQPLHWHWVRELPACPVERSPRTAPRLGTRKAQGCDIVSREFATAALLEAGTRLYLTPELANAGSFEISGLGHHDPDANGWSRLDSFAPWNNLPHCAAPFVSVW